MSEKSEMEDARKDLSEPIDCLSENAQSRVERIQAFMENEIWFKIPQELLGTTLSKEKEEAILGYGKDGV